MKHTLLIAGALLATSHSGNTMSFDDCYTWETRELANELSHEFRVLPNSGRCQSLSYTDKLTVREYRKEMLKMAKILHLKAALDDHVSFFEKVQISRDLSAIYGRHALLYIEAK